MSLCLAGTKRNVENRGWLHRPKAGCGAVDPRDNGVTIDSRQDKHQARKLYADNRFGPGILKTKSTFESCIPSEMVLPYVTAFRAMRAPARRRGLLIIVHLGIDRVKTTGLHPLPAGSL